MKTREAWIACAIALGTAGATSTANCPLGTFLCSTCGNPGESSAGDPGLTCPIPPGGVGVPPVCTQYISQGNPECISSYSGSCNGKYICCPDGYVGYFSCNQTYDAECYPIKFCNTHCCQNGVVSFTVDMCNSTAILFVCDM
jgi:hypothetical protein